MFWKREPRCNHDWKILSDQRIKSIAELVIESGVAAGRVPFGGSVHITICTCAKCGDIKKFETRG